MNQHRSGASSSLGAFLIMRISQVQVEISEMSRELFLRHTEPAELGRYGIHSVRGAENGNRTAVLGEHRRHHHHLRSLHHHGKNVMRYVARTCVHVRVPFTMYARLRLKTRNNTREFNWGKQRRNVTNAHVGFARETDFA